jgi:hypothetical protein
VRQNFISGTELTPNSFVMVAFVAGLLESSRRKPALYQRILGAYSQKKFTLSLCDMGWWGAHTGRIHISGVV